MGLWAAAIREGKAQVRCCRTCHTASSESEAGGGDDKMHMHTVCSPYVGEGGGCNQSPVQE